MNPYLKNLTRVEFVVTMACTGRCKHCSQGDHKSHGENIDKDIAAEAVRKIAREYNITSVMTSVVNPYYSRKLFMRYIKLQRKGAYRKDSL